MGEAEKQYTSVGLLAHVDAGKTTLTEALLYCAGVRRTLGRVDHRDAFLDTHSLERARGITIFSKQAIIPRPEGAITLADTPGHVDFSAEAERVLPVLDCAVLVISGTEGIQSHTVTLWQLLTRYQVPTFLFINKMDLPGANRQTILSELQQKLSPGCLDFGTGEDELRENAALCDEALLESYLAGSPVTDENLRGLIAGRRVFPCCFGSGLKLMGIEAFYETLCRFAPRGEYGPEFGAQVYKISRDPQGSRLTWLKLTGGSLRVREPLRYQSRTGDAMEEKAVQLRLYSGDKFTTTEQAHAGMLCAVTGLSATYIGQGLGAGAVAPKPAMEPVMTYRVRLSVGCDPVSALQKLRQLEEEDPQLRLLWDADTRQIHAQLMGQVQKEILRAVAADRFGLDMELTDRRIFYKETIASTVEGVGHFEPLRHYAEVHLLLEPGQPGSGLVFDTVCPTDVLDVNYQKLVLTHLEEKAHKGILMGAPITDMKITLLIGKAHLKHTEGGDFRQATYRAVRQGLMQAEPVLLEPWYRFTLTLPTEVVGRAITDIRTMGGEFDLPEAMGQVSILKGTVPAAELGEYATEVAAYTQGRGQLQLSLNGYAPCHNTEAVVASGGYDPEADAENTPDSVFCAHGAGFHVRWDQVKEFMHLESGLKEEKPALITRNLQLDDRELEAIMEREFGPVRRPLYRPRENPPATENYPIRPPRPQSLIVDGYNVIFAWEELAETAGTDLDAARRQLIDQLSSYAGFKKCRVVLVFDGYKRKGNPGQYTRELGIQVVFTPEGETADSYIESLAAQIGKNDSVRVVTSDSLVQLSSFRSGVLRMSAKELQQEVEAARKEMQTHFHGRRG